MLTSAAIALAFAAGPLVSWVHVPTTSGALVHWDAPEVVVRAAAVPTRWSASDVTLLMEAAAATWTELKCTPAGDRPPGVRVVIDETLDGGLADGVPSLTWIEDAWPHGSKLLALTTLEYDDATGVLSDADIAFNVVGTSFDPSLECLAGPLSYDLLSTLTHEVGHLLGLGHSTSPTATMFETSSQGACGKRTLAQDDRDGLCALYEPGAAAPPEETGPPPGTSGVGCSGGGPGSAPLAAWLLLAALWRRRIAP